MSPLRQKQMRTKLRVLENNFINSVGDKDFKRAADELNRYRQVVSEHKIKGRSDDDIMKAWQDRKQEGLRSGRLAGYQKGVIDPKTGKRVFASAVDNPNAKDIINNPLVDIADVVSSAFIVGALTKVGIKGAAALIKDPSLFTKLPQQSKNLVTNVVNRIKGKQPTVNKRKQQAVNNVKGKQPMAKKQLLEYGEKALNQKWVQTTLKGYKGAARAKLEDAIQDGATQRQVNTLKSILTKSGKNAGKINSAKWNKIPNKTDAQQNHKAEVAQFLPKSIRDSAPTVASDLAKVGGGGAAATLAYMQFVPEETKQRLTDAKYAKRIDAARKPRELSEREKEAKKSGKKPEKVSKTSFSSDTGPEPQKSQKAEKKAPIPRKRPAKLDSGDTRREEGSASNIANIAKTKLEKRKRATDPASSAEADLRDRKAKEKKLRKEGAKAQPGGGPSSSPAVKKKKTGDSVKESLKDMIFKQDKRKYGPFTVDSTDRGMSKYGDSDNWKELEAEEEMNLRKGGTARRKAFGKGGMYKTPKKAYGMRKGGFTRRGASR